MNSKVQVMLKPATFRRFLRILRTARQVSLWRALEYEKLQEVRFEGRILDFGGGERAKYRSALRGDFALESANISEAVAPTYKIEVAGDIPVDADTFDAAISLNTFEHIFEGERSLAAVARVLKTGGLLHLAVPFIFQVHGHPDDYVRGTPSYWARKLSSAGFTNIHIQALVWGNCSTAATIGLMGPFKRLRFALAMLMDLVHYKLRLKGMDQLAQDHPAVSSSLGYWITAQKA